MLQVTDRVPTYAGRIQLIVVDEANGIYDMVRADEPKVVGTPLNAALFNSIAADLANIAPPILNMVENVANSKNVAFYPTLGATGLECDASVTTETFLTSVMPLNSAVFCSVTATDTIILNDLPFAQGTLLLMKGDNADNRSGLYCPKEGGIYLYALGAWGSLVNGSKIVEEVLEAVPEGLSAKIAQATDGTVTITVPMSDGTTSVCVLTPGADGFPASTTIDGVKKPITWEGW